MQREIMTAGPLLDEKGNLRQKGWGRSLLRGYQRSFIKANKLKIKEWDYYAVLNESYGLALTVADNGYLGIVVATVFDFRIPQQWTKDIMIPFSMGKMKLPETSGEGDLVFAKDGFAVTFRNTGHKRVLEVVVSDFADGKNLEASVELLEKNRDSLMIATPFDEKGRFYYNHKINGMVASGYMKVGSDVYDFDKVASYGVLDWGRGVWTYDNTWYWGSASGEIHGHGFGFNIGYGFGDTSNASENIVYYDGVGHKLDEVVFHIPEDSYESIWEFSSNDGRFEMKFEPVIDRCSKTKVMFLESDQHQVFGYFSGVVVLDDGSLVEVDRLFGFAEKVKNKW